VRVEPAGADYYERFFTLNAPRQRSLPEVIAMSQSMKCMQCASTFRAPTAANARVACPHCGAMRVVAEKHGASAAPASTSVRPPLTDEDVLAFLDQRPVAKPPSKR
jgi:DNA-directed RNA polymerase subunit RPC12/RpoP